MGTLHRNVSVAAGPRGAWNAFTTAEGLRAWLAENARIDAREGGRVTLRPRDGGGIDELGLVHTCRPTARLELRFDSNSPGPWKGGLLGVHIGRDGARTSVRMSFESALLDIPGAEDALGGWWDDALARLRTHLDG